MAPEVINAQDDKDWKQADIWSIGCLVLEMATGHPPWVYLIRIVLLLYT